MTSLTPEEQRRRERLRKDFYSKIKSTMSWGLLQMLRRSFGSTEKDLSKFESCFVEPAPRERLK